MTISPQRIKTCCADAYSSDIIGLLLGECYHPGGVGLTHLLGEALGLGCGARRLADVACGRGASARLLAGEYPALTVDGVDLSEVNVEHARAAAAASGLAQRVRFHRGDAERLPLPDNAFDALVCECALCTFPNKNAAAQQFARILRPGGLAGITDVTITDAGLPAELTTLAAWAACIAGARSVTGYTAILAGAGLRTRRTDSHDGSLLKMIDRIEARVTALRIAAPHMLADNGIQPDAVLTHTRLVRDAVKAGRLGYTLIIAEKT
ncbi:class I SAM-dependent methyltransferase [Mycobacterium sp. SM1]|uniref:class I SAM-dependent methyltransferase n=1 Tax=Mycobacterium sp. SM1 TaxID=2816243 RepID=UPI001F356AE9|nr:class I SAM-dependent methyltransferase [Mycobacterium sp. SM1]